MLTQCPNLVANATPVLKEQVFNFQYSSFSLAPLVVDFPSSGACFMEAVIRTGEVLVAKLICSVPCLSMVSIKCKKNGNQVVLCYSSS